MNISDYLEEALLNHVFRNTGYASPANVYCGIVSNVAIDADMEQGILANEIVAYAELTRPAITFGAPAQVLDKATISNTNDLDFTVMPAVTVKYAIVMDSNVKGAGNILYWCPLTIARAVTAGDTFRIPIGDLVLDLA